MGANPEASDACPRPVTASFSNLADEPLASFVARLVPCGGAAAATR
jgi:hypothetical protein